MLNAAARSLRRPALQYTRLNTNQMSRRTLLTLKDVKYKVTATATGQGRSGPVESNGFTLNLSVPGSGDGQNPEQLFAMGYASCFLLAIQRVAEKQNKLDQAKAAKVHTTVSLGEPTEFPGFGLAVDIKVEGVDGEVAKGAHEICPYSRALKHGAVVNISTA